MGLNRSPISESKKERPWRDVYLDSVELVQDQSLDVFTSDRCYPERPPGI